MTISIKLFLLLTGLTLGLDTQTQRNLGHKEKNIISEQIEIIDEFGFIFKNCGITYFFEIKNNSANPIFINSLKTSSGADIPFIWGGNGGKSCIISPGKSTLIGVESMRAVRESCNMDSLINRGSDNHFYLGGGFYSENMLLEKFSRSVTLSKKNWASNPTEVSEFLDWNVYSNEDSLKFSTEEFPVIFSYPYCWGLIKVHNMGSQPVMFDSLQISSDNWTWGEDQESSIFFGNKSPKLIKPGTSILVPFRNMNKLNIENNELNEFIKNDYQFDAIFYIHGISTPIHRVIDIPTERFCPD